MCTENLALNKLQWLICYKTQSNLNGFIYCYLILMIQFNIKHLLNGFQDVND